MFQKIFLSMLMKEPSQLGWLRLQQVDRTDLRNSYAMHQAQLRKHKKEEAGAGLPVTISHEILKVSLQLWMENQNPFIYASRSRVGFVYWESVNLRVALDEMGAILGYLIPLEHGTAISRQRPPIRWPCILHSSRALKVQIRIVFTWVEPKGWSHFSDKLMGHLFTKN
jgi:hypothetical protein